MTDVAQSKSLPVSVVVVTKNEERRIARCLQALQAFSDITVVDSASTDKTAEVAKSCGAAVVNFEWNGKYPKKYQWCLDHLDLQHDYILFVDADEIVTPKFVQQLRDLDWSCAGYFVRAAYVVHGKVLRFGLKNNKLALIDRCKMVFPVVDDLDCPDMGEIEGHYQPVLKPEFVQQKIGQIDAEILHETCSDWAEWDVRHARYARWEVFMDAGHRWPQEVLSSRRFMKRVFKHLPCRGLVAFLHSYILKLGFLDGAAGFALARSRYRYYKMIMRFSSDANTQTGKNAAA